MKRALPGGADGTGMVEASADPEVVSVGSAIVDRYYRLSNLPERDGGSFAREEWTAYGGVASNVACATATLGHETAMLARVGRGDGADGVVPSLRSHGVDTSLVRRSEEPATYSMVLLGPDGDRMVVTGGESATNLRPTGDDWPALRAADVVFTNAYAPDAAVAPLVEARADGELSALAFDLSGPLAELVDRGVTPDTVDAAIAEGDLFVAGEVALRSYCRHHGVGSFSIARAVELLRELGVTRAALTAGDDGATLVTPDGTVDVPAFDVETVDATGAGDAFTAGLLDAWLLGDADAAAAGRWAAAAAALNCTARGARGGLPDADAVERFLADRDR